MQIACLEALYAFSLPEDCVREEEIASTCIDCRARLTFIVETWIVSGGTSIVIIGMIWEEWAVLAGRIEHYMSVCRRMSLVLD